MARPLRQQVVNLPNLITYARIAAIPLVVVFMEMDSPRNAFVGAMAFAAAGASDALDGYLARRLNLTSIFGKFLDPLADKLIVTCVLVMLVHLGRVPVWVVMVILSRELTITGLRSMAASEGLVIDARELGKTKTAFQMVGLWALVLHYPYPLTSTSQPIDFHRMGLVFLYISLVFSLVSAVDYFAGFFRAVTSLRA